MSLSLFLHRPSGLHRLHPLTKLSLAGFLLIAGLFWPGAWTAYGVFVALVLPLALWGQVLKALLGATWRVVVPFAISVLVVQGFFWPGGTPLLMLGPLALKREGVDFAAIAVGRILAVAGSFTLLALTTRPDALMTALTQQGWPGSLAYIVVTTIQIVPRFQAKASAILDAQQARGLALTGPLLRRARAILPLVVPLILGSLVDVEERALALEARAFNHPGPKTSFLELPEAAWEPLARWALMVVAAVGLTARWWWR